MVALKESQNLLIQWAAEGIAPVVAGCSRVLGPSDPNASALRPGRSQTLKPIAYFGPAIVDRWAEALAVKTQEEQLDIINRLAALSAWDCQRDAEPILEELASQASSEDRSFAIEYLKAIPLAIRRSLVADPATGRLTVPSAILTQADRSFFQLLPSSVPPFAIGSELPGTSYRLEELLGIGGFGAVYKARNRFEQNQPPRAIKFCLEPSMLATLNRERTLLDRLMAVGGDAASSRIVRLYGYALDAHPPFLVYEFVPGGDLTGALSQQRQRSGRGFDPDYAFDLIRQAAEALAFAHSEGLVHRDLKPANVLVSGPSIKLTDFGIGGLVANHLRNTSISASALTQISLTDQAQVLRGSGTPLYMSPEQRRGDNPDPRHDLYSLGVMWYQLIVGDVTRELHPGWTDELKEEFQTPRAHTELIQRCVGYFKKRPAHAEELLNLLGGPTRAGEVAPTKPVNVIHSEREACRGPENEKDIGGSLPLQELHCFAGHDAWVRSAAFALDGGFAISGGDDGTVRLWDLERKEEAARLRGHAHAVMSVAVSSDGRLGVSGGWDGVIRVWDLLEGREIRSLQGDWTAVKSVLFALQDHCVLAGCDDLSLRLWEIETGHELLRLQGHKDLVQGIAISPATGCLLSGGDDGTLRLWSLEKSKELLCLPGHADSVTSVAFAPDGRLALSGSSDHTARLWDLETGKEIRRFTGHANWVNSVAFGPEGKFVLTGSGGEMVEGEFQQGRDHSVRLWDVDGGEELCCFADHQAPVTSVAYNPTTGKILSASLDRTVRLLGLPRG